MVVVRNLGIVFRHIILGGSLTVILGFVMVTTRRTILLGNRRVLTRLTTYLRRCAHRRNEEAAEQEDGSGELQIGRMRDLPIADFF